MNTWKINGKTLEFIPDGHYYLYEGVIVPSVTQILSWYFRDEFKFVKNKVLFKNAALGTEMHSAIELYENEGIESDLQEFKNYKWLKAKKGFKVLKCEIPIIYFKDGKALFVGRLDQIIELNGKLGINDLKRQSSPNKEKIAYQLNLYKLGYEQLYNEKIEFLSFTQLREDVRKFVPVPINKQAAEELLEKYHKEKNNGR